MVSIKCLIFSFLVGIFFSFPVYAQHTPDCKANDYHKKLNESDPELAKKESILNNLIKEEVLAKGKNIKARVSDNQIYTLPVVVHIMHLPGTPVGTDENISDELVIKGIQEISDGFRNRGAFYMENGVDLKVELCLAKRDTNGQPASGILRHATTLSNLVSSTDDLLLKSLSNWNSADYVNIWIVKEICSNPGTACGVAGYATLASSHGSMRDGVVMESKYFGTGKNNAFVGIHEFGHYFNLLHTFDQDNLCTNTDCLSDGDMVCDTPPDKSAGEAIACNLSRNSCTSDEDDFSQNNPFRPIALGGLGDQNDFIDNYMTYGYVTCINRFTQGQADRAIAALTIIRSSLLVSKGCEAVTKPPVSNFIASSKSVCQGSSIQFFDKSENGPTKWYWSFPGGVPSTSTERNPVVTYNQTGSYTVSLSTESTLGTGSALSLDNFVTIYNVPATVCRGTLLINDGNYEAGILRFNFLTIDNTSRSSHFEGGYVDYSCTHISRVGAGFTYPFTLEISTLNFQYARIFIDFNNNGIFTDDGEQVWFSGAGGFKGSISGNIQIPLSATTNTLLRMRIFADIFSSFTPCSNPNFGQAEDYGIFIPSGVVTSLLPTKNIEVIISPNPVKNNTVVSMAYLPSSGATFSMTDVMGHEVKRLIITETTFSVEKSGLRPGLYFYKIIGGADILSSGKIIVED